MPVDMSKEELEGIGFRSMSENRCECDCMISTCTDCFIRGKMKPWCSNCHSDINDGKCCDNQSKPYIKKGWIDVTPHIVKHNEAEKKEIHKRIEAHNKMLDDAKNFHDTCWMSKDCEECGVEFSTRGKHDFRICKKCTLEVYEKGEDYKEERMGVKINF